MDKEQLQQKIREYYLKLSPNAQASFGSMTWIDTLEKIFSMHPIDDEQKETVITETMLVMLGIIHLEEYENIILNGIGLEKDISYKLLVDIDKMILKDLRSDLTETFMKNSEETEYTDPVLEAREKEEDISENINFIITGGRK